MQTNAMFRKGIAWLRAKGFVKIIREKGDTSDTTAVSEEDYHLANELNKDLQEMQLVVAPYTS